MKRTADTPNFLQDVNALNEEILEAANKIDGESLAPEVSARTAEITDWDESPEDVGWRVQDRPIDNEVAGEGFVLSVPDPALSDSSSC